MLTVAKANGQANKNNQDAEFLRQAVRQLPSFKDQVKSSPSLATMDLHFKGDESTYDTFMKLYTLIAPLRDNHLTIYTHRDSAFAKPSVLETPKSIVDSALKLPKTDSVCGTYFAGNYQMLIIKTATDFRGVIENQGKYFTQFLLKQTTLNHFDMIMFVKGGASYAVNRNVVYANGRLVGTPYKKYKKFDFINLPANSPKYDFKILEPEIAYLRLGSFATTTENIAESVKFFEQIKLPEGTKNLIVDLRDNGGGGYKTSKKFLDLIKRFDGRVHLLTNSYTVSNAEQFAIDLLSDDQVVRYGETTRGTITYGNNQDTVLELPSKRFKFYITDMSGRSKDIAYESYGIEPQVKLDPFEKDWVAQVVDHIKRK